jgi:hypothetical protein
MNDDNGSPWAYYTPGDWDRPLNKATRAREFNELKTWAEGFKLTTPVPRDLMEIITKDEGKRLEIAMRGVSLIREEGKDGKQA